MEQHISYKLPVTIFRGGKHFVAYSPAVDLSSSGKSEQEARRMFTEAVEILFEELTDMGTLDIVLKDLGWTKAKGHFQPPEIVDHSVMNIQVATV
ncbi:MAG: hypothetical protein UY77_C0023G0013 [Candidatus Uhrbacteria bacterium GW2011_GWA2_53_10]|uniref:HicB-like antitoxin of toxin-antitoxin system domain-containing protein n=1 Tax=Candidatus Uhrbacteria bacterium GW2011_GWA2_53_10 TaxID=1618980 RepID=A0A0G2AIQ1_9BACT|nr:MAG: hypothetical protein UY77_C0023G0013 [Candidatus Uhrbacteria bacterium GW2011_GWA2_53_10]